MADKEKKQVPLRLSKSLYNELMKWAEDDFRSLNGQIEYLLTDCVRRRKRELGNTREDDEASEKFEDPSEDSAIDSEK